MDSLTKSCTCEKRGWISIRRTTNIKRISTISYFNDSNLIERTGSGGKNEGSITSFYTILADSDDTNDPVVDTARAISRWPYFYPES